MNEHTEKEAEVEALTGNEIIIDAAVIDRMEMGELSDDDLELVAGGVTGNIVVINNTARGKGKAR